MKNTLRLAFAYMRYYKKQTAALFVGIFLAAALLTGVGSLFASGKEAVKENARTEYYGVETVKKAISDPFEIQYVYGNEGYMEIMGRQLLEGRLPEAENEIAADVQTLRNLGVSDAPGSIVELDGETFTLTGIVSEMPEKLGDLLGNYMQVFVSPDLDYGMNGSFLYLRFDEASPVLRQMKAFAERYGIDGSTVARNNGMSGYVGAEETKLSAEQIWTALMDPSLGIPWIWGSLNENEAMTDGTAFGILITEMALILAGGYTAGALLGNGAAALIYRKAGRIFITRNQMGKNVARHTGISTEETVAELSVSALPDTGAFHVDFRIIWGEPSS